jgi:hypothetical protein
MKAVRFALTYLWWVAAAYLPFAQFQFNRKYSRAIGCPASGDCYVDGSEHLLSLDLLLFYSAALLWPACAWMLFIRPLLFLARRHQAAGT